MRFLFRLITAPIRAVISLIVLVAVVYFAATNWGTITKLWNDAKPMVDSVYNTVKPLVGEAFKQAKPYLDSVLSMLGDSDNYYSDEGAAILGEGVSNLALGEVKYGGFDDLGRTTGVMAYLSYDNIEFGSRPREEINDIKPSGWLRNEKVTVKFSNGRTYNGWFYNRSHLLAHSLGGDDKDYNLITGTRMQNVGMNDGKGGMQVAETLVKEYIEDNPSVGVYYVVKPYYEGNELVARHVTIDIKSDDGVLNKRYKVYNMAKGFEIDYMTGEFRSVE